MKNCGIKFKYAYLCGTEIWSPSLKLSDRCKHVHAVVHVDLLYTVKHGTEDTAQRGTVPEFKKKTSLIDYHIALTSL